MSEHFLRGLVRVYTRVRSVIGGFLVGPHTAISSTAVVIAGMCGGYVLVTTLIRVWAKGILLLFGIRVNVSGEENLPLEGGGVILFNHQSLFDIPVVCVSTLKNIRFGAKIELFSVPFFGSALRASGTLPIARENRSAVMKIYKEAEKRFKENTLFVLAPEGTRQKDPVIGRFKKGPFIFALDAGVPIIPVVIKGTHAVLPKKSLTVNIGRMSRVIQVQYLPPIATKGLGPTAVHQLTQNVREIMVEAYARLPEE